MHDGTGDPPYDLPRQRPRAPRRWPQRRATRVVAILGLTLAALVVFAIIGFHVVTNTDWGRERVRRVLVSQLGKQASGGRVHVGRITGNLARGMTVHDLVITDSAGAPFVALDSLRGRYRLSALWRRQIDLDDVLIANPTIVLDRRPGGQWNWKRIFPGDTLSVTRDTTPGFGDFLRFTHVLLLDAHVVVRSPWEPRSGLSAAQRDSSIRSVLAGGSRLMVVRVPGGFQKIVELRELYARMPLVQLADPKVASRIIDVAEARTDAYPFRPPAAEIRNVRGRFSFTGDSLWWNGIAVRMPASYAEGSGMYLLDNGDMRIETRGRPIALADFRWLYPRLPSRGGGPLDLQLQWTGARQEYVVRNADLRVDRQRVRGEIAIRIDDDVIIRDSDVRFANLDTRTIEQVVGGFDIPRRGTLDGRAKLRGNQTAMQVDAQVAFHDRGGTGTSEVAAVGEVGYVERGGRGIFRARNLRTRLLPLRLELAQAFAPTLPVGGTLTGSAVLDGASNTGVAVRGDLTHREDGTVSRAAGRATVRVAGTTFIDADVRLAPLAMPTVAKFAPDIPIGGTLAGPVRFRGTLQAFTVSGDVTHREGEYVSRIAGRAGIRRGTSSFIDADIRLGPLALPVLAGLAPGAGLRGSVSGQVALRGTLDDFTVRGTLALADGGSIAGGGRVRPAGDRTAYDIDVVTRRFDPSAISTRAPTTDLNGRIAAEGVGFEPATMRATVALNLDASQFEGAAIDSAAGRLRVANGLAAVERLQVRGEGLIADARGSFGLRRDRSGVLTFSVAAPSIAPFRRYVPGPDAGEVPPRPGAVASRLRAAREDSARIARATEVERAISGRPAPAMVVDTPRAIPRRAVQGSLFAAGTLRGNIHDFNARGRIAGEDLVVRGHAAEQLRGEFAWSDVRGPGSQLSGSVRGSGLRIAGFSLDSAEAQVAYAAPNGRLAVALWQGEETDYAIRGEFALRPDANELVARDVALRFDTTLYSSPRPFAMRWGGRGVEVDQLELVNNHGGRVYADGRLPLEGSANLDLAVTSFQVGDVLALTQSDLPLRGLLTAEGTMRGALASPRFDGAAGLAAVTMDGTSVPSVRGRFTYLDRLLTGRFEALHDSGGVLALVEAEVPVNLALSGVTGDRFSGNGLRVDLTADSLPLAFLGEATDYVSDVGGTAAGRIALRGSLRRPDITGAIALTNAQAKIEAAGVTVKEIAAMVRMAGDTVVIDSLVGRSDGRIRVRGGLGIGNWREPAFDLYFLADEARVIDDPDLGELYVTAGLALRGPFASPYLSGQATVEHGVAYMPSGPQKHLVGAGDPAVVAVLDTAVRSDRELLPGSTSPLLRNLRADVDIAVNRNTWVRSRDINVEIYTEEPVSAHVEDEAVALTGIVNTDRGEYELFGKRFQVSSGSVMFIGTPEINPTLQVTAQYEVRLPSRPALTIKIIVGGTMRAPRISLESDAQPPISQTDLLSLVAFGTESSSLVAIAGSALTAGSGGGPFTTGLAATRLFAVALGLAVDEAEAEAGRALGVDVFNIRPADVPFFQGRGTLQEFLLGTEFAAGKYVNPNTFIGIEGVLPAGGNRVPPGIRIEHRTATGFRIESAYRPRYLLREPTLSTQRQPPLTPVGVFSTLLIREWRF